MDGCYQCVFHYRQGRNRRHISRTAALEMLDALVEGNFQRKQVKCLSEIYINPDFGSELERRFLPALKALGGQLDADNARFPAVQVTQDIKGGKTAYLLTTGPSKYWVDTQVPIEDLSSGQILCQPDFVISATKSASPMRPIAVFVDGWEFHQQSMSEDARKRATLMLRGEYRVWSVTFEDIEAAHKLKGGTDLDSPLSVLMTECGQQIKPKDHPADSVERPHLECDSLLAAVARSSRCHGPGPVASAATHWSTSPDAQRVAPERGDGGDQEARHRGPERPAGMAQAGCP